MKVNLTCLYILVSDLGHNLLSPIILSHNFVGSADMRFRIAQTKAARAENDVLSPSLLANLVINILNHQASFAISSGFIHGSNRLGS